MSEPSSSPTRTCHNCGAALTDRWCAACGQEDRPLEPTLRDALADAWDATTNLEGRAFRSFGRLFLAPGFLTLEYLHGRRVRWVSPVRLYLLISVVYFGLTSLTGWGALDIEVNVTGGTVEEVQQELEARGYASEAEMQAAAEEAVGLWLPRAMFLLLPIFAGLVALTRRSARKTYPQHLVFALHVHAAVFAALTLAALVTGPVGSDSMDGFVNGVALVYAVVYLVLAERTVYGGSWARNAALGVVTGLAYWGLAMAATIGILLPIVLSWS